MTASTLLIVASLFLSFVVAFFCYLCSMVVKSRWNRKQVATAFFHPYTNDGGGGEKLLWCVVKAVQEEYPNLECFIYTGDDATPQSLSACAIDCFGIQLLRPQCLAVQGEGRLLHDFKLDVWIGGSCAHVALVNSSWARKLILIGSGEFLNALEGFIHLAVRQLFRDLVLLLGGALFCLHSMIDEHFGICIVEYGSRSRRTEGPCNNNGDL